MSRQNGNAMILANTIEGILNFAAGPMNIPLDDLRQALRKVTMRSTTGWHNMSLDEARDFIGRHLSTALEILADKGWSSVKTTQQWEDAGYPDPGTLTEAEIKKFIAGVAGYGSGPTAGLHFNLGTDDWLWLFARDHGAVTWRGKRSAETRRLQGEIDNGRLTPAGIAVAERSADHPKLGDKKYRKDIKKIKP